MTSKDEPDLTSKKYDLGSPTDPMVSGAKKFANLPKDAIKVGPNYAYFGGDKTQPASKDTIRQRVEKKIYCTGCEKDVEARLTDGEEIYPHRPDLYDLPFWKCDTCGGYVGCHHKTSKPTKPLGYIATPAILDARKKIHALLDPLWRSGKTKRGQAYAYVSKRLGKTYHNGEIKSLDEAREIYRIVLELANQTKEPKKGESNESS